MITREFSFQYLVFHWDTGIILVAGAADLSYEAFHSRFGIHALKVDYIDESYDEGRFFVMYSADCMDPPLTVVRADNFLVAMESFVENTEIAGVALSNSDLEDYLEYDDKTGTPQWDTLPDCIHYTGSGVVYDTELINGSEVHLIRGEN